jgi:hypothetical protein
MRRSANRNGYGFGTNGFSQGWIGISENGKMTGNPSNHPKIKAYHGPAGGWGSAKSVSEVLLREHVPAKGPTLLAHQNKPDGYM